MSDLQHQIAKRRTFAIISHPDAGKTTLTEKLLLFGGAIQLAGSVKSRKAARHATSDWMAMERERGISVTSSVMQFPYRDRIVNLLDTPGHADFSEDTYRVLSAVDSALMVIDAAKGVEERTIKLMEVCRMRDTPIFTFINKLDREIRDPMEVLDEIEKVLGIQCAPVTWPIGSGKRFKGIYHLPEDAVYLYSAGRKDRKGQQQRVAGLHNRELEPILGAALDELRAEIELVRGASHAFDRSAYRAGKQTPVFFGSALNNFGVTTLLNEFVEHAPPPLSRATTTRIVEPDEAACTGFVFKIQANMDPKHRDRVAFMRICSGSFQPGKKLYHTRIGKDIKVNAALTFLADSREQVASAYPGDIIGLHNHGTVSIGDTFTEGEDLQFTGVPNFAPELFKRARLRDPLRLKQLRKGLDQLCEEGATQFFRPMISTDLILGAIGSLQFDLVAFRLKAEYNVDCLFEPVPVVTARWVGAEDRKRFQDFQDKNAVNLATDHFGDAVYLAPSRVNLQLTQERWPEINFNAVRERAAQ